MKDVLNKKTKRQQKVKWNGLWLGVGGLLLLLGGLTYLYYPFESTISAAPTPQNIEKGAQLFAKNCAICHGPQAQGQDPQQPRGGMKADGSYLAPALNGSGHAWHHGTKAIFDIIKNGSRAENSAMLGFKDRLSDEDIRTVIVYLKSLWPEKIRTRHDHMSQ